jgi:arylsulfatase A-like enzyme
MRFFALSFAASRGVVRSISGPHIVAILADDFGWADAGWHRPDGYAEIATPELSALVKEGVEMD